MVREREISQINNILLTINKIINIERQNNKSINNKPATKKIKIYEIENNEINNAKPTKIFKDTIKQ